MSRVCRLFVVPLLLSLMASAALAADNPTTPPKVDRATAEKKALARVPGGQVKEGELEREHGRLVWSFDIAKVGSPNITEVQVDATTGKVVSVAVETPADQAQEAAQDRAKAGAAPAPR